MISTTANLLAVNASHSVMLSLTTPSLPAAYCPFGTLHLSRGRQGLSAFNGMLLERNEQGYLLGNGYRLYRPHLRRFTRPDEFSPFGRGGLNGYAYCEGDPVNNLDPSGQGILAVLTQFTFNKLATNGNALAAMIGSTLFDLANAIVFRPGPGPMAILRSKLFGVSVTAIGWQMGSPSVTNLGMAVTGGVTLFQSATKVKTLYTGLMSPSFSIAKARENAAAIFGIGGVRDTGTEVLTSVRVDRFKVRHL
ncbi:RHS repeat-associated core domain-containing protein [Pseudomonas sp. nanlin1]|uniref:RHS repeat-associated core domain-containing protein n=1 Tax=Pseudomonas sp. nanlin1 TaxID=3040605 RepID=UPI00388FF245